MSETNLPEQRNCAVSFIPINQMQINLSPEFNMLVVDVVFG